MPVLGSGGRWMCHQLFAWMLRFGENVLIVEPIGFQSMTAGYAISVAIRRVLMGSLSAFAVMLVVWGSARYLELMPPEPEASRYATWLFFSVAALVAILGLWACKIAMFSVPLFCLMAGLVLSIQELQLTGLASDLNGDGVFTIRDFATAVFDAVVATGSWYLTFLNDETGAFTSTISTFFEIPLWVIEVPAKILLTVFWWGILVIGWARLIWKFKLSDLQTDNS